MNALKDINEITLVDIPNQYQLLTNDYTHRYDDVKLKILVTTHALIFFISSTVIIGLTWHSLSVLRIPVTKIPVLLMCIIGLCVLLLAIAPYASKVINAALFKCWISMDAEGERVWSSRKKNLEHLFKIGIEESLKNRYGIQIDEMMIQDLLHADTGKMFDQAGAVTGSVVDLKSGQRENADIVVRGNHYVLLGRSVTDTKHKMVNVN